MKRWTFRLLQPFIVIHAIIIVGIIGFMLIEKYTFVEAMYMTTISITTAGFQEVRPLSDSGRLFTMFLLITSWISFAFVITRITEFVITGEINKYFKTRRIMNSINKLTNHVIICGYGRNGQQAVHNLKLHGVPVVFIEKDVELINRELPEHNNALYIVGDSTDDDLLMSAGVQKAKALITTLPADADNLFIVLSARSLNPGMQIISRASESNSISKLKKAGADNVIMPDRIGGAHMATLVTKPDVIEFIDYLSGEEGEAISMESVGYEQLPDAIKNKSLWDIMNWKKTGVNCIGIKSAEGKFLINPPDETIISKGMKVIVLGTRWQIEQMKGNLG
ncbi:MAG: potassium channel protein [Bacteroidetes bacterium]|nr:potassium channel protein [Bacteroidota bacterium]